MSSIFPVINGALNADVSALNLISQNVANLQTPGYLTEQARPAFSTALKQPGVLLNLANGPLVQTGRSLDLALQGPGFFVVDAGGETLLERNGQFARDAQGRLVDTQGFPVLGQTGPLILPDHPVQITASGEVLDGTHTLGRLRLVSVAQPQALQPVGNNLYAYRGATDVASAVVHQGALEQSNVNAATEMIQLIALSRHVQSLQTALSAYDQAMDAGVQKLGTGS
ncbi:MAG: flagellar hook basal-body protein [Betaproteobacteria bacterium]|nr:flagellar hook basal-body protein [Betaproteobacteria bacterium]